MSLCPPREVTPLLGQCGLAVTVVCTELLKHTFPLVLFVADLNCLLFPCVLAHYFLLIHSLCNYLGNAGELAGIWRARLLFLGVDDFVPMQPGRVGSCPFWVTSCTPRPFCRTDWLFGQSTRSRERVCVYFLVYLVGLKPELFFDILYLLCIMALYTLPWRHAPDLNPSLSRATKGGSLFNLKRQNCTINSSKHMPGDFVYCESFQLSLRSACVLGLSPKLHHWRRVLCPFSLKTVFQVRSEMWSGLLLQGESQHTAR